ncbi:MAG: hypothetical protein FJ194_02345 [Gammaproteobacteria bacterium]|nr:hypothetical protein [Gammaproteobacteria bacterium]
MKTEIHFQAKLTSAQSRTLAVLVGSMIPASDEHGVPGADDPLIFADILKSLGRETVAIQQLIGILDERSGGSFVGLPIEQHQAVLEPVRQEHPLLIAALITATARCYYRDDRVMHSLGMEARPPFPKGFEVHEGDWALLDPVKARGPIWRNPDRE